MAEFKKIPGLKNKVIALLLMVLSVLFAALFIKGHPKGSGSIELTPDLTKHPLYSRYNFKDNSKTVNIGFQPVAASIDIISACMKRDRYLVDALTKQGFKIRFYPFLKGADINFFLSRGDIHIAMAGDMPALTAASNHDVIITSLLAQSFNSIVANANLLISDLKGKRIGYAPGSNAHFTLLHALASAGMNERDVTLVPMEVLEMPDVLYQEKIDAFSAWEPTPTIALSKYKRQVVINRGLISGFMYASRSFADHYPEVMKQIIASKLRALNWLAKSENLHKATQWTLAAEREFTGKSPVLELEQSAQINSLFLSSVSQSAIIPERDIERGGLLEGEFKFLQGLRKISADVQWEKVKRSFENKFILKVLSDPRRYGIRDYGYSD